MKVILLSLILAFAPVVAFAKTYACNGANVSGKVQVKLSRNPTSSSPFPSYTTHASLAIGGRPVRLACAGNLSYFEREIPFGHGAWEYDKSIWILALCGANLGYGPLGEGFHLEISGDGVRGYLGHRDHLQSPEDLSAYDFTCR